MASPLIEAASSVMIRAMELEKALKFTESLVCYQESISLFIKARHSITDERFKKHIEQKISDYLSKAEQIKELLNVKKKDGKYHEQICIKDGDTGYGYKHIFNRFLEDGLVQNVYVDDPYIRASHQNPEDQRKKFGWIKEDIAKHGVNFIWSFSNTLHDREIRFDNGWIVKIGRGLDYLKRPEHKYCGLGVHDYHFRSCLSTTIDIFHSSSIR